MPTMRSEGGGHAGGLAVLFLTEMWERYSFYSMSALLTLYMDEALRFDASWSATVYGAYIGGVYFLPLVGGAIADRLLGFRRAVVAGGVLMLTGHLALARESATFLYVGLALLAAGSGLLKPNVSTLVGNLYRHRPHLRDTAFNIFYMGINIGGFMAPYGAAWVRARYGWGAAFASAAGAMALSLVVFVTGRARLRDADLASLADVAPRPPGTAAHVPQEMSREDVRSRVATLLVIFVSSAVFWFAFFQDGFALTFWARDNTVSSVSPEVFRSVEPLGVIVFSGALALLWGGLRRAGREPSTPSKMTIGVALVLVAYALMAVAAARGGDTHRVSAAWLVTAYLIIALGEVCLSPMGLSLVNRLAPARMRGMMMGGWFVSLAVGGWSAGALGRYWTVWPHSQFFGSVAVLLGVAAAVLLVATPRMMKVIDRA